MKHLDLDMDPSSKWPILFMYLILGILWTEMASNKFFLGYSGWDNNGLFNLGSYLQI